MSNVNQITNTPYFKLLKLGGKIGIHAMRHRCLNTSSFGKLLRTELVKMGPSYVKIGQMLSSREDLLPEPVTHELQLLQDKVAPFAFEQIEETFMQEFDEPLSNYFKSISRHPIASASIGQVHKGVLLNSEKEVVIKVQRPDLESTYIKELLHMKNLLEVLNDACDIKFIEDLYMVINECFSTLAYEIDFMLEKNNALSCSIISKELDRLRIPRVYSKLTSKKIIVMEYCPGIKINDTKTLNSFGVDKDKLAKDILKTYIIMLTKYGYLHGDPHPGNIALDKNTNEIILYDFGIFERYDPNTRKMFMNLLISVARRDVEGIITQILADDIILMKSNAKRLEDLDPVEYMAVYELITILLGYIDDLSMEKLINSMKSNAFLDPHDLPFVLHGKIMLILKTFGTLEGLCKTLNPKFKYRDYILDIGKDIISSDAILDKVFADISLLIDQRGAVYTNNTNIAKAKSRENHAHNYMMQTRIDKQNKLLSIVLVLSILSILF